MLAAAKALSHGSREKAQGEVNTEHYNADCIYLSNLYILISFLTALLAAIWHAALV